MATTATLQVNITTYGDDSSAITVNDNSAGPQTRDLGHVFSLGDNTLTPPDATNNWLIIRDADGDLLLKYNALDAGYPLGTKAAVIPVTEVTSLIINAQAGDTADLIWV